MIVCKIIKEKIRFEDKSVKREYRFFKYINENGSVNQLRTV